MYLLTNSASAGSGRRFSQAYVAVAQRVGHSFSRPCQRQRCQALPGPGRGPPSSESSSKPGSKPGQQPAPPEPPLPDGPKPPVLSPQLQRIVALLTGFGGVYGTIAVLVAYFTHLDPFGNFHYDQADILHGLQLFVPLLLLDAVIMLPDYSLEQSEAKAVLGEAASVLSPVIKPSAITIRPNSTPSSQAEATSTSQPPPQQQSPAAPSTSNAAAGSSTTPATNTTSSSSSSSSGPPSGPATLLQLRLALELLQQFYTRVNPGRALHPVGELVVVSVATLAEEMLYRAVAITLLGLWLRDRLFEAGVEGTIQLPWGEVETGLAGQHLGLAFVAALGVTAYAGKALQERRMMDKLTVLVKDGDKLVESPEVRQRLAASIGTWNSGVYLLDGVREVLLTLTAGVAWVHTGNLAASYAGSLLTQVLFSTYQRYAFQRATEKRRKLLQLMQSRASKIKAAMAAAAPAPADSPTSPAKGAAEGAASKEDAAAAAAAAVAVQQHAKASTSSSSDSIEAPEDGLDLAESSIASWDETDITTPTATAATTSSDADQQQQQQQQQQQEKGRGVQPVVAHGSESAGTRPDGAAAAAVVGSPTSTSSNGSSSSSNGSSSIFDPSLFEDWSLSKEPGTSSAASQQQQQQQQQVATSSTVPTAASNSSSSSSSSNADPGSTMLSSLSTALQDSSNSSRSRSHPSEGATACDDPASSSSSSGGVGEAGPTNPALVALLEDMLRSPEGHAVVARMLGQDGASARSTDAASTSAMIDSLLSDPATKALLLAKLEEQLYDMSQKQQQR